MALCARYQNQASLAELARAWWRKLPFAKLFTANSTGMGARELKLCCVCNPAILRHSA